MIKRKLVISRLKEECIEEYIGAHKNIWTELILEYKESGIKDISCFLNGRDLYVYIQYDEIRMKCNQNPMPFDEKWQKYINGFKDSTAGFIKTVEVFHME